MIESDPLAFVNRFLVSRDAKSLFRREVPFPPISLSLRATATELGLQDGVAELESDASALMSRAGRSQYPLIGVAGMLNSGKSSTICLFLSDAGRRRVLTGEGAGEGTQRFVFWLPEQLRHDSETLQDLKDSIRREFEAEPEPLSDDPTEAKRQYNTLQERVSGRVLFGTPLVGFDSELDKFGFGLLDCPDVQRRQGDLPNPEAARLEFVRRAAKLLSAVCFVSRPEALEDGRAAGTLQMIGREIPGLPVVALVNMATPRNWDGSKVMNVLAGTLQPVTPLARVFLSFHADAIVERVPVPSHSERPARDEMVLPNYQRIDAPGHGEGLDTYFRSLDPEKLVLAVTESRRMALANRLAVVRKAAHQAMEKRNRLTRELRSAVLGICQDSSVDGQGNPRLAISPKMAKRIFASIRETAPWWAKAMLTFAELTGTDKKLSPTSQELKKGALQALRLAERTKAMFNVVDPGNTPRWTAVGMEGIWAAVLERTRNHLPASVSEDELRSATKRLWEAFEKEHGWKAAVGAITVVLGLVVLLVTPIGWGAAIIGQASIAELLALGGAAGVGALAKGALEHSDFARSLEQWVFPGAFANLFAFSCDAFGLPREIPGEPTYITINKVKQEVARCAHDVEPPRTAIPETGYWMEIVEEWEALDASLRPSVTRS